MDIWQTGNPQINVRERTGWLARYFDSDGHFKGNPLSGITLGSALPLTLFSDDAPASVIGGGSDFGFVSTPGTKTSRWTPCGRCMPRERSPAATPSLSAMSAARRIPARWS